MRFSHLLAVCLIVLPVAVSAEATEEAAGVVTDDAAPDDTTTDSPRTRSNHLLLGWSFTTGWSDEVLGGMELMYHRDLSSRFALRLGALGRYSVETSKEDPTNRPGVAPELATMSRGFLAGFEVFPLRVGTGRLHVSPRVSYEWGWQQLRRDGAHVGGHRFSSIYGAVDLGWRWVWDYGWSAGFGLTAGYVSRFDHEVLIADTFPIDRDPGIQHWIVGPRFTVGAAF